MQPITLNPIQNTEEIRNQNFVCPALLDICIGGNFGASVVAYRLFFDTFELSPLLLGLATDAIGIQQYSNYPQSVIAAGTGAALVIFGLTISNVLDPVQIITGATIGAVSMGFLQRKFKMIKF